MVPLSPWLARAVATPGAADHRLADFSPDRTPGPHREQAPVYWANGGPTGTIGRADLDGTGADQAFITGASVPGVAVDAPAPPATIAGLIVSVEELGLPHGIERSLLAKLDGAQRNLDADDLDGACGKLGAFINQVRAQGGKEDRRRRRR